MGCAIPSILIASSHIVCGVVMQGDCEMEGIRARTAFNVYIVVCVSAALVEAYVMPGVLLASILIEGVVCAVMDYEVECVNVSAR